MKVIKAMKKMSLEAKEKTNTKITELKQVIFAKPITNFKKDYVPTAATASQQLHPDAVDFLTSVVTHHADFVLSNLSPQEVTTLIRAMESVSFHADDVIIRQGDIGDYLYVLKDGDVKFVVDDVDVGTAPPGTVVGELALLYDAPRAATVIAQTACVLYRVSQETFRRIQASFVLSNDEETRRVIKDSSTFAGLPDVTVNELAACLFEKKYKKGDIIMKKGDPLNEIYYIKKGHVLGSNISIRGTKYANMQMKAGDSFGERALVMNEASPADGECLTDVVVWILQGERLFRILGDMDLHQMIEKHVDQLFLVRDKFLVVFVNTSYCKSCIYFFPLVLIGASSFNLRIHIYIAFLN